MRMKVCAREGCYNVFDDDHGRKYCSANCRSKAYYQRQIVRLVKPTAAYKGNCRNCGRFFVTLNRYRVYCSDKCKQQHYRERKELDQAHDEVQE